MEDPFDSSSISGDSIVRKPFRQAGGQPEKNDIVARSIVEIRRQAAKKKVRVMRKGIVGTWLVLLVLGHLSGLGAQDVYVYPARNQSDEQMGRDKEECHDWAVKQTGVDPEKVATAALNQPSSGAGSGLGGAGFGAARGAMSGDAAAGAVRGVGIGRLLHAIRARRQMEEQQKTGQQEHQQRQAQLQNYDRAFSACLTGRGYTVQ
jgi:hypothetical protein